MTCDVALWNAPLSSLMLRSFGSHHISPQPTRAHTSPHEPTSQPPHVVLCPCSFSFFSISTQRQCPLFLPLGACVPPFRGCCARGRAVRARACACKAPAVANFACLPVGVISVKPAHGSVSLI